MGINISSLVQRVSKYAETCCAKTNSISQIKTPIFKNLKIAELKLPPKQQDDIVQLSKFENSNGVKNIINTALGGNKSIQRSFDLTRFSGIFGLFKKSIKQYKAVDLNKSNFTHTFISDYISCYYSKGKKLEKFFIYNLENKDLHILDKNGNMLKYYSPEETFALQTYNHSSRDIHKVLRYERKCKKEDEIRKSIDNLSNIFNSDSNVLKTTQDIIAYRALDKHSLNKIMSMPQNGMIFEDPSFVSVATKKRSVFQFLNFKNFNHIMQVKIPKDSKCINMDEIGNIIILNPLENELLLNKGSQFLIKNKPSRGMIYAEYIQK